MTKFQRADRMFIERISELLSFTTALSGGQQDGHGLAWEIKGDTE